MKLKEYHKKCMHFSFYWNLRFLIADQNYREFAKLPRHPKLSNNLKCKWRLSGVWRLSANCSLLNEHVRVMISACTSTLCLSSTITSSNSGHNPNQSDALYFIRQRFLYTIIIFQRLKFSRHIDLITGHSTQADPPPLHLLRRAMWSIKLYVQPHENWHYKNSHCVCVCLCAPQTSWTMSHRHTPPAPRIFLPHSLHTRTNNTQTLTRWENVPRRSPYFRRLGNKGPSRRFLL